MSRPKKGRPIDKRKECLVRGVELLGTVLQKPDSDKNCGDSIKTSSSEKTPVMSIAPHHPTHKGGGNTIQQYCDNTNNSNKNYSLLLSLRNETATILNSMSAVILTLYTLAFAYIVHGFAIIITPIFTVDTADITNFKIIAVCQLFSNFECSHCGSPFPCGEVRPPVLLTEFSKSQ
nr:MAG TPA: zinc-ribbon domain protein [Caudoviricetes sp.]